MINEDLIQIIGLFRHGDRTTKQKIKMKIQKEEIYNFYKQKSQDQISQIILDQDIDLQEFQDVLKNLQINQDNPNLEIIMNFIEFLDTQDNIFKKKLQIEPIFNDELIEMYCVLKWGGKITHSGLAQSEKLGSEYRDWKGFFYLLKDQKELIIYCQQKKRCIYTAASFYKGFNNSQSDIKEIIDSKVIQQKKKIFNYKFQENYLQEFKQEIIQSFNKEGSLQQNLKLISFEIDFNQQQIQILNKINDIKSFLDCLNLKLINVLAYLKNLTKQSDLKFCRQESIVWIYRRWKKVYYVFYNQQKKQFDITKINNLIDCIQYDLIHNKEIFLESFVCLLEEINQMTQQINKFIYPLKYGPNQKLKLKSSFQISNKLFADLKKNIHILKDNHKPSILLYFTTSVHIYNIFNIIKMQMLKSNKLNNLENVSIFHFLSHLIFKIYKNKQSGEIRIEFCVSTGQQYQKEIENDQHLQNINQLTILQENINLNDFKQIFEK